ncbi:Crystal protein [Holothuria leucospilota]|uniref:Crystal protein n=1 Tax=Holothuria leucospilota TaxID=206669 RepID=A0A9Q1CLK7_HOLLE|nr:Crystal protein [Holothuria leucospilota]
MTSPQDSALFHRVILFSEPFALPLLTKKDSLALGLHFASLLSCQNDTLACLRSKAPSEIATATKESENFEINNEKELLRFQVWGPTVEEQPVRLFEVGLFQSKPIMLGSLTEEARLYVNGLFDKPVPSLLYTLFLTILVPEKGNIIMQQYPADNSNSDQRDLISQIATDYIFECPVLHVAKEIFERGQDDVYHYVFDQAVSEDDVWDMYSWCNHHTCHGGDIPFFFGTASLAGV